MNTAKTINLNDLRARYHSEANDIFRWLFASTASSVLKDGAQKAAALQAALREAKIAANHAGLDELANEMLGRECVAAALEHEAQMWLSLRQELPHEAWGHLVDAEQHVLVAVRTPIGPEVEVAYSGRFSAMQRALFPHMMFLSAGFNHDEGFCTICDQRMSTCPHIKGRIYCGQVCAERGFEKFEADHVAIVEHPMDKHCYIGKHRTDDGKWIDRLSGEKTSTELREETAEGSNALLVEGIAFTNRLPIGSVL